MIKCIDLMKSYVTGHGSVMALDGVSLEVRKGEVFGLVGESGSGKTTLGKVILGLVRPDSGRVEVDTRRPQVIFQDPINSLDPKMRVGDIVGEGLRACTEYGVPCGEAPLCFALRSIEYRVRSPMRGGSALLRTTEYKDKIARILELVKLPQDAIAKYPHQFSGGERQRIAIARALVTDPELIVCDEPVSSLDVTVQLQVLRLLKEIHERLGITYLFISHDLRVIKFMCDRVAVMKDGKIVEEGRVGTIYSSPAGDYTRRLLASVLRY
jgi:peptide/nickel transport system ATP-binding protein